MWLFTNHGFFSIVQHDKRKDTLIVRARRKEHLEAYFTGYKISYKPERDYQYRIYTSRKNIAEFLFNFVEEIDYTNFKNSIKDEKLKSVASMVWHNIFAGLDEGNRTVVFTPSENTWPSNKD
tara:strand:- start:243 stop:608 length:366 start_codon:yes stop_codon:yes gene_type:complete